MVVGIVAPNRIARSKDTICNAGGGKKDLVAAN